MNVRYHRNLMSSLFFSLFLPILELRQWTTRRRWRSKSLPGAAKCDSEVLKAEDGHLVKVENVEDPNKESKMQWIRYQSVRKMLVLSLQIVTLGEKESKTPWKVKLLKDLSSISRICPSLASLNSEASFRMTRSQKGSAFVQTWHTSAQQFPRNLIWCDKTWELVSKSPRCESCATLKLGPTVAWPTKYWSSANSSARRPCQKQKIECVISYFKPCP